MTQKGLAIIKKALATFRHWDELIVCAQCRDVIREDACRVTCTCASAAVYQRVRTCVGVYYCPKCFESLRREDGTLPPEWPSEEEL